MTSNLISKNIDNYFNDLINKPVIITSKKTTSFTIFYKDYIEHNLLLIFIIIFMGIFLLFKYYSKEDENNNKIDDYNEKYDLIKKKKIRNKLSKEREILAKEKNELLSIIDELSELNIEKINIQSPNTNNNNFDNKNYIHNENYVDNDSYIENKNLHNQNLNNNPFKVDAYKNNNLSSEDYYDVTEKNSELINGIYFETPYN